MQSLRITGNKPHESAAGTDDGVRLIIIGEGVYSVTSQCLLTGPSAIYRRSLYVIQPLLTLSFYFIITNKIRQHNVNGKSYSNPCFQFNLRFIRLKITFSHFSNDDAVVKTKYCYMRNRH